MSFATCGETNDMELAPTRCISAPLLPRVLSGIHPLGSFFQILLCFHTLCNVIQEVLAFVLRHGSQLRHDAFHKAAVQKNAVIALLAFLNRQFTVEHLVSVFVLLQLLLRVFQFSITFFKGGGCFLGISFLL